MKIVRTAVVGALLSTAALAQPVGPLLPGFGSSSAPPRMLVIMDTSKSMRFAPNGDVRPPMDFNASAAGVTGPLLCNENTVAGTSATHNGTVGKTAASEGQTVSLSCGVGETIIEIDGLYGKRSDNHLDCAWNPHDDVSSCSVGMSTMQGGTVRGWLNVKTRLEELCRGNNSCVINVQNANLGPGATTVDPCYGETKHLQVKYRCGSLTCTDSATSNKFCMAKRVLYEAVNNNSSLLEIAAGGYYQAQWQKLVPGVNSNLSTTCSYDVVASAYAGVGLPAGSHSSPPTSPHIAARWETNYEPTAAVGYARPNYAANPANFTSATGVSAEIAEFQCRPEDPAATYAIGSPMQGECDQTQMPAIPTHRCFASVRREGGSWQDKYQNTNGGNGAVTVPVTACTRLFPSSAPAGANLITEACLPPSFTSTYDYSIALNTGAYRATSNSFWDTTDTNRYYLPLATVQTALSNPAATCADAPTTLINMVNGAAPPDFLSGPALTVASCTAANKCAYFKASGGVASSTAVSRSTSTQTRYCDPLKVAPPSAAAEACPTAASVGAGWSGPVAGATQTANIPAASVGGTCPATAWFTAAGIGWSAGGQCNVATGGGCWITRTNPAASTTPITPYSCPAAGYATTDAPITSTSVCSHQVTRYSAGLTITNSSSGATYTEQPGSTWTGSYKYRLKYADVRDGVVSCLSNAAISTVSAGAFPAASASVDTYAGGFPASCAAATSGNESTNLRCQVQGNSYAPADVAANGGIALGKYMSDSGTVECEVRLYTTTYKSTKPSVAGTPYCGYSRTVQTYTRNEDFCRYERFVYRFARDQYRIWAAYNDNDFKGTTRPTEITYPSTAEDADKRCGGPTSPHATWDPANGFTLGVQPAGVSPGVYGARILGTGTAVATKACAVELNPGEADCPAAVNGVARCKLRWSGAANNRFRYQRNVVMGSTTRKLPLVYRNRLDGNLSPLKSQVTMNSGVDTGPIFCPVGDPDPQASPSVANLANYATAVTSWCTTTNTAGVGVGVVATPPSWLPTQYVADVYHPGANNPMGTFTTPTGIQRYLGFNIAPSVETPWGMTNPFSNGDQYQPKLAATKASGLSVLPPFYGVVADLNAPSFSRWAYDPTPAAPSSGDELAAENPLQLFDAHDPVLNPRGLRMPDLGDVTPLTGALDGAKQYITAARLGDGVAGCRRYSVMLLTDGLESPIDLGTDPRVKIDELRAMGVDTYVIGFGNGAAGATLLNEMAQRAGTSVNAVTLQPDPSGVAFDATSYVSLSRAVNRIIGDQLRGVFTRSRPTISTDGSRVYSAYFSNNTGGSAGAGALEFKGYLDAFVVGSSGSVGSSPLWKFDQRLNTMSSNDWLAGGSLPASGLPRYVVTRPPGHIELKPFMEAGNCGGHNDELVRELNRCGDSVSGGFSGDSDCSTSEACGSDARDRANQIIRFVRNDRPSPNNGLFRDDLHNNNVLATKESRISDVFHSVPFLVGKPSAASSWTNPTAGVGEQGDFDGSAMTTAYTAFKNRSAYRGRADLTPKLNVTTRESIVYLQSNTGTVHAVREDLTQTDVATLSPSVGTEKWAFVPTAALQKLDLSQVSRRFLADGSFAVADVCFGQTACERADGDFDPGHPSSGGWFTMLIGSLGRLGPHLFALDITDPRRPVWLWDFNSRPHSPSDDNMGMTLSAPVVARVNVHNKSYEWGVFTGGGLLETQAGWDNCNQGVNHPSETAVEGSFSDNTGNAFYVLNARPTDDGHWDDTPGNDRTQVSEFSHGGHHAKWCIPSYNRLRDNAPPNALQPNVHKNNVPGRVRVWRPNEGSRAYAAYFGDTDGKLWRSRVTSDDIDKWEPKVFFNPYHVSAACLADATSRSFTLYPLPDTWGGTVPPPSASLPLTAPLEDDGLPSYFTRPFMAPDDVGATATGAMMLYAGSGDPTHPETHPVQNYFWALEDKVTTSPGNPDVGAGDCAGVPRWGYSLDRAAGEKVLGDPAIIGTNIIVGVYVPYGGAGGCGQAGFSKLYCFNRATGEPANCLVDNTNCVATDVACDQNSTMVAGQRMSRYVRAGQGMISDLRAVGNTVVFTTSTTPDTPNQIAVINANVPFRIKSWRRVR